MDLNDTPNTYHTQQQHHPSHHRVATNEYNTNHSATHVEGTAVPNEHLIGIPPWGAAAPLDAPLDGHQLHKALEGNAYPLMQQQHYNDYPHHQPHHQQHHGHHGYHSTYQSTYEPSEYSGGSSSLAAVHSSSGLPSYHKQMAAGRYSGGPYSHTVHSSPKLRPSSHPPQFDSSSHNARLNRHDSQPHYSAALHQGGAGGRNAPLQRSTASSGAMSSGGDHLLSPIMPTQLCSSTPAVHGGGIFSNNSHSGSSGGGDVNRSRAYTSHANQRQASPGHGASPRGADSAMPYEAYAHSSTYGDAHSTGGSRKGKYSGDGGDVLRSAAAARSGTHHSLYHSSSSSAPSDHTAAGHHPYAAGGHHLQTAETLHSAGGRSGHQTYMDGPSAVGMDGRAVGGSSRGSDPVNDYRRRSGDDDHRAAAADRGGSATAYVNDATTGGGVQSRPTAQTDAPSSSTAEAAKEGEGMSRVGARDSLPTAVVETVRMLLRKVDPSANSVTGTSEFMSRWKDQASAICGLLAEAYCSNEATSRNRLALFYVFNDLVQKYQGHFAECGVLAFLKVISSRVPSEPAADKQRYMRTLSIWHQRNIYPQHTTEKLRTLFRAKYPVQHDPPSVTDSSAQSAEASHAAGSALPGGADPTRQGSTQTSGRSIYGMSTSFASEELAVVRELRKMVAASRALSAGDFHHVKQLAAARLAADVTDEFGVAVDISAFHRLTWSEQQVLMKQYERGVQATVQELEKLQKLGLGLVQLAEENSVCLSSMAAEQQQVPVGGVGASTTGVVVAVGAAAPMIEEIVVVSPDDDGKAAVLDESVLDESVQGAAAADGAPCNAAACSSTVNVVVVDEEVSDLVCGVTPTDTSESMVVSGNEGDLSENGGQMTLA